MKIESPNFNKIVRDIKSVNKSAESVLTRTVSDFRNRAPAWIGAAVTETYGISKKEVKEAFSGAKKTVGRVKASGREIDGIGLEYSGRVLTPVHFKMRPGNRPANGKPYQITMEVYKEKRRRLSSNAFLGSNKGGGYIPFQREGKSRFPIKSVKTVSVPQMIENKEVAVQISENIDAGLGKRIEHHLNQAIKRRG